MSHLSRVKRAFIQTTKVDVRPRRRRISPIRQAFPLLALLIGFVSFVPRDGAAQEAVAARAYAQQMQISFIGLADKRPEWQYYGSNAKALVKFEPEGLRITIPAGFQGLRPPYHGTRPVAGLAIGLAVKGDFEITTSYELLSHVRQPVVDDDAAPKKPATGAESTRFTLDTVLDGPRENVAVISRRIASGDAHQFHTWMKLWNEVKGKHDFPSLPYPAQAKSGRLRVVRTWSDLSYFAAENNDGDFKLLRTLPFAADDVIDLRLIASTGDEKSAFDVRITDLSIRAAAIAKAVKKNTPPAVVIKPPAKEYAQEYYLPFKGGSGISPGWQLHGPGAEECVSWAPEGLRLSLPTGWDGERPSTGIKSAFGVKGDFEITFNFEMLKEHLPNESGKLPTRLSLEIFKEGQQQSIATVSRSMSTAGSVFVNWSKVQSVDKPVSKSNSVATDAKTGRLRLVRSGADLYFGAAKGFDGEFQYRAKHDFGNEDLIDVRIMGSTGSDLASLDARVTDLRIRADAIPNMPSVPAAGAVAMGDRLAPAAPRDWTSWLLGGAALLLAIGVAAWLFGRRRDETSAATTVISFRCACGKLLKAKLESTGKDMSCPVCGKVVTVPK